MKEAACWRCGEIIALSEPMCPFCSASLPRPDIPARKRPAPCQRRASNTRPRQKVIPNARSAASGSWSAAEGGELSIDDVKAFGAPVERYAARHGWAYSGTSDVDVLFYPERLVIQPTLLQRLRDWQGISTAPLRQLLATEIAGASFEQYDFVTPKLVHVFKYSDEKRTATERWITLEGRHAPRIADAVKRFYGGIEQQQ